MSQLDKLWLNSDKHKVLNKAYLSEGESDEWRADLKRATTADLARGEGRDKQLHTTP